MITHYDKLGQQIAVDDFVAFSQGNGLMIGRVARLSNKMLIIDAVVKKKISQRTGEVIVTYRKYPTDSVKIDQDAGLTMYVIRNS
jgi:hypothetical protein